MYLIDTKHVKNGTKMLVEQQQQQTSLETAPTTAELGMIYLELFPK